MSNYQRRHYTQIAQLLAEAKPTQPPLRRHWEQIVRAFAILFKGDNFRFDRQRFFKAAGVDENE